MKRETTVLGSHKNRVGLYDCNGRHLAAISITQGDELLEARTAVRISRFGERPLRIRLLGPRLTERPPICITHTECENVALSAAGFEEGEYRGFVRRSRARIEGWAPGV
jgi:hypothetical protein